MLCFYLFVSPATMWNNRILYSYNYIPLSPPYKPFQYFSHDYGKDFVVPFGRQLITTNNKLLHFNRSPVLARVSASGKYCDEDGKGYASAHRYLSQKARLESSQIKYRITIDSSYSRCAAELSGLTKGSIISFSMVKEGLVPHCRVKHLMRYIMSKESLIINSISECEGKTESVCFAADMALAAEDILDSYHSLAKAKVDGANTYLVSIFGQLYIIIGSSVNNEYFIFTRNRRQSDDDVIQYLIQNESNEDIADEPNLKQARFRIF